MKKKTGKKAGKKVGKAEKIKPDTRITVLLAIVGLLLFYWMVSLPINGVLKFFLAVFLMAGVGITFEKLYSLEGFYGLNLFRDQRGLGLIDDISRKNPEAWKFLADVGLVLAFGASAKLLFRHVGWKSLAAGIALLSFLLIFVLPIILPVSLSVINFPVNFEQSTSKITAAAQSNDWLSATLIDFNLNLVFAVLQISFSGAQLLIFALILLGGFVLISIAGLALNGIIIIFSVVRSLQGDATALAETAPGASFILPGINIPFIEGVLALTILLVVHEGMHGVLARIANNKIISTGLVFFGALPAGAFVEPDEKQLAKKPADQQSRVLVAGSTANFYASLISFFLLLAFLLSTASNYELGIAGIEENKTNATIGATLYSINGVNITDVSSYLNVTENLTANSTLFIVTSNGSFTQKMNETKLGFLVGSKPKPGAEWLEFFYNLIALVFVLNFLVGSVNLLPIPLFDGYRLVSIGLKNERATNTLAILVVISFLLNFVPWVWH